MNQPFICDQTFEKQNYTQKLLPKGEYDNCQFIDCDFSEVFLSSTSFMECEFINCNLSSAKVKGVMFKDVSFVECKLLGVLFQECNPFLFSISAKHSNFSYASFYAMKLTSMTFESCNLDHVDFTNANASKVKFIECSLSHAIFKNTNLEKTDLQTATNFSIQPEQNNIKQAKFSTMGALLLLNHYQITIE
ncbi:pentapeptide repeat-containing protein [Bizionia argentinensis JUB59]|uniref:Pentapeptide repeat-containing protein n=1 Tax=Bizionia argentinensis JUB59 TaxID=1046627 RepID=G2EGL4_9FLAO|nr:pentapeptide repeat-containing protein [Bizionia argentinensis]EGV42368.2 pentapeptide repeat-containing protein [Bizionia argentinensis JUB59]